MIIIWHRTIDLGNMSNSVFFESGLVPVAIINTDCLETAAKIDLKSLELTFLSQRLVVNFPIGRAELITAASRNNAVGDILCRFHRNRAKCFQISSSGFREIEYYLPHVGIPVYPEPGDPFEDFPTLNLKCSDSVLLDRVGLPSYNHGCFYLETRCYRGNGHKLRL